MPQFDTPTQAEVIRRVEGDFRLEAEVNPLRYSVEYGLLRALAGQSKGLYGFLENVRQLAFPDTAVIISEPHFWRWASVFGIDKKGATPWRGTYRFTGVDTTAIPAFTELVRSDGWRYYTLVDAEIGSEDSGQVDVAIEAIEDYEGAEGNNTDGSPLALATPISDVDSEGSVRDTTNAGEDEETGEEGFERLLARYRTPARGGGAGDYVTWALEVPGVTRAWEASPAPGEVTLRFVRDNDGTGVDILPDAGEIEEVRAYVQSKAPLTVVVSVLELSANLITVEITDLDPDTSGVRDAIELALEDFFVTEAEPGGEILVSRISEAISAATGESSHTLVTPAADYTDAEDEISIFDGLTVT